MSSYRHSDESLDSLPSLQPSAMTSDVTLETLMESVNLDSIVACRKDSIEYMTLSKIVSFSPMDADEPEDELPERLAETQSSESQLVQDPFTDSDPEHGHAALFRFLFEPLDPSSQTNESSVLTLSDELIGDLQNLKDRMQHRYNVIKRNILNGKPRD